MKGLGFSGGDAVAVPDHLEDGPVDAQRHVRDVLAQVYPSATAGSRRRASRRALPAPPLSECRIRAGGASDAGGA